MPSRPVRAKRANRTEKIDLRLTAAAKRRIRDAAAVQDKSVTEFVLESALTTADVLLAEQSGVRLNAKQWAVLMEALDAPPQHNERLERLLREPSAFD